MLKTLLRNIENLADGPAEKIYYIADADGEPLRPVDERTLEHAEARISQGDNILLYAVSLEQ